MTEGTKLNTIFIADSYPERIDEVSRLVSGFAPDIQVFDGTEDSTRGKLVDKMREEVRDILSQGGNMMLITNCIMGVQAGVFRIVRGYEAKYNIGARKILLSCKGGAAVNRGFRQRGQSKIGIRHVVWNGDDIRRHQDDLRRVLRSDVPMITRLRPWETLEKVGAKEVVCPDASDATYAKYRASFSGEEPIVGYALIHGKRYLVGERQGVQYVYTQIHY